MAIYSVYQPPIRAEEAGPDPLRFQFVRDGFHFWAFLITPLWLLWHRMWLIFVGYVLLVAGLEFAVRFVTRSDEASALVMLLMALLTGFEAPTLRRWSLTRRRWKLVGNVIGDDVDSAERRFFDAWSKQVPGVAATAAATPASTSARPISSPEVIGLFPEPGASR